MIEITHQVKVVWDWETEKIAKEFGFFSYNTGAPRWDQVNMYIVDILMEELGATEWSTDGVSGLMAVFEVKPAKTQALIAHVTKELQNGDLSRFRNKKFYPHWLKYRRMRRAQGGIRIVANNKRVQFCLKEAQQ